MINRFKQINREDAQKALEEWVEKGRKTPVLEKDYDDFRRGLLERTKNCEKNSKGSDYKFDVYFGYNLYIYLEKQSWFNVRLATDDGFWRYLSICVIPDVVASRWKNNIEDHCWKKSQRIWLKTIWWFIYLSFNNTQQETLELLLKPTFNTDIIFNLVERSGKKGFYVDVTRRLMYYYGKITPQQFQSFKHSRKYESDNLFRALMRLNTVRLPVLDPMLVEGGADGYVRSLFRDFNITFE